MHNKGTQYSQKLERKRVNMATIRSVKFTNRISYQAIIRRTGITKRGSSATRTDVLKWSRFAERNMNQGLYVDFDDVHYDL